MRGRWLVLVVLALGAGLPSVAPATSRATVPSGNLLANPGAEDGTGSTDSSCGAGGTTPGWMGTTGGFTAVQYGTSSYPSQSVSNAIGGGQNFFTGGCSDTASGSQFIDLSAYSALYLACRQDDPNTHLRALCEMLSAKRLPQQRPRKRATAHPRK